MTDLEVMGFEGVRPAPKAMRQRGTASGTKFLTCCSLRSTLRSASPLITIDASSMPSAANAQQLPVSPAHRSVKRAKTCHYLLCRR